MREPPSIPNTESEYTTELEMTSLYSGQVTDVKYTTTTTDLFLQDWKRRSFRAGKQKHPLSPPIGTEKKLTRLGFISEPLWFCYY